MTIKQQKSQLNIQINHHLIRLYQIYRIKNGGIEICWQLDTSKNIKWVDILKKLSGNRINKGVVEFAVKSANFQTYYHVILEIVDDAQRIVLKPKQMV